MEHWHRSGTALLDEIAATHLPASQLAVWYIGQCGFLFKCGETTFCVVLAIDCCDEEHSG